MIRHAVNPILHAMMARQSLFDAPNGLIFHDLVSHHICKVQERPFLDFF